MKTNIISKWAALLLTVSSMAALPWNEARAAAGENKLINTATTVIESGSSYRSNGTTNSALQVTGNGAVYSGTNVTLTGTANTSDGRYGAYVLNQGSVSIFGGSITTTGSIGYGFIARGTSSGYLKDTSITTTNYGGYGVVAMESSTMTITGGTITTSGVRGNAIHATSGARVKISDLVIHTSGSQGYGIAAFDAGTTMDLSNVRINTEEYLGTGIQASTMSAITGSNIIINTTGPNAIGVVAQRGGVLTLTDAHITTSGSRSYGLLAERNGSTLNLTNSSVNTSGERGYGLIMDGSGTTRAYLTNVDINTTGANAHGVWIFGASGDDVTVQILVIDSGNINAAQADALNVNAQENVGNADTHAIMSNTANVLIKGGASLSGATAINVTSIVTGTDSSGNLVKTDMPTTVNIRVEENSSLTGDVLVAGGTNANVDIVLVDSTMTGDLNGSGSSTLNISGSNGSTVTGTANGKDDATINVNISGPGSSWLGDVNQEDNSKIVINLDNGASGTGGFNGGDLIVGKDSEFTFDKDSHGNNGKNDGTWNIGDKNVNFDNLENNGKIVINVNTDSGTPKGSLSTDNGSGNGTIVINPGGNGTGNPNDILNNIVSGPGTDGWTWEDIDWGLKQYEVTPNADGTVSIKETGKSSTVSALTTGLIAAQQNSWFAQQNSLLKRMGELRLAQTPRSPESPRSPKEITPPTADALISNIWLRSYGAQYNYGTQVTGRSFKQYTYGVDIGTDHKWTLNADNDLYTGAFVGYGAADTDHRYNGSESNLNNYYAGLYASWLNNSGWYLDATLKLQYSDHELKGYHGGIDYFNAKYNNWSVGGSVELGKKFDFQHGWFVEPQLQANYLYILADDYSVSSGQQLNVSELDAFQLRFGIVAGKTLKLKNGGALQPYVKISGVEMVSTGGKISMGYNSQRPNLDGARAELGAGIIWQLDQHNQLHLDYEASFGDKYDKPWGLTAGYRYQF